MRSLCALVALVCSAVGCVQSSGFDAPPPSSLTVDGDEHAVDRVDIYVKDEKGSEIAPQRRMVIHAQAGDDGPALVLLLDSIAKGEHAIVPFGAPDVTLLDGGSLIARAGTVDVKESSFAVDGLVRIVVRATVSDPCGEDAREVSAEINGAPQVGVPAGTEDALPPATGLVRGTLTYDGEARDYFGPAEAHLDGLADDFFLRPAWTVLATDLCGATPTLSMTLGVALDVSAGEAIPCSDNDAELFFQDIDHEAQELLHTMRAQLNTTVTLDDALGEEPGQVVTFTIANGDMVEIREDNPNQLVPNGKRLTFESIEVRAPLVASD